jgi:hypothetical protein
MVDATWLQVTPPELEAGILQFIIAAQNATETV